MKFKMTDPDKKPFVSVMMPVRNEAGFIRRSVQAVLAQDYPADRIEVIVIDGMSDDGTRQDLEEMRKQHPNLMVLENSQKIVSTALNIGIRRARGEIIVRVDGHCIIDPSYVSECVNALETKKVDGVGGSITTIGETFVAKAIAVAMSSWFGVGGSAFRVVKNREMMVETVPFPAYRKEIFQKIGFYDEELVRNQDDEFNYRLKKADGKILLSPKIHSAYYSRSSLAGLWRQYFQYGFWKVRVFQKHPRQMQWRHFAPPAFAFSLVFFLILCFLGFPFMFLVIGGAYAITNISAAFYLARERGWKFFFCLPVLFCILHLSYGFGFLGGVMKFFNRWNCKS